MKNLISVNHLKLYDLFDKLRDHEENLILQGNMSDELTVPIIDYNSISDGNSQISQKKLSFFIAESFQNIIRHGKSDDEYTHPSVKPGTFGISKNQDTITLHSSNLIGKEDAYQLDGKLKGLSILTPDELREVYISALSDNEISEKGGAGLGLIEMVRKSKGAIKHKIEISDTGSFFHFDVSLNKDVDEDESSNSFSSDDFHDLMKGNGISILIKTHFNHEKFIQLNNIVNRKIIDSKNTVSNNIQEMNYFFIELIQNIYKHGDANSKQEKEGIFILKNVPNGTQFCSGNFVTSEEIKSLETTLDTLNNATDEELNKLYRSTLLKNINFDSDFSAGLGLLEMKRMTPHKFEYNFTQVDNDTAFFVNSITLEH